MVPKLQVLAVDRPGQAKLYQVPGGFVVSAVEKLVDVMSRQAVATRRNLDSGITWSKTRNMSELEVVMCKTRGSCRRSFI